MAQPASQYDRICSDMRSAGTHGLGLLAAVALWPLRVDIRAYEGDAIDTVRDVIGPGAESILVLVRDWGDNLLAVANDLHQRISADTELQAACAALEVRFTIASQLAARIAERLAPQRASAILRVSRR